MLKRFYIDYSKEDGTDENMENICVISFTVCHPFMFLFKMTA